MAIDSISKRYSALNFSSITDDLLPVPSGSIDVGDQATLLALYSGITLEEAADVAGKSGYRIAMKIGLGL